MPRQIDHKLAAAWRSAGFHVAESGKVFTPPKPLRPETRPPGFSKLPEPTRSVADARRKPPSELPRRVANFSDIPAPFSPLYVPDGTGFARSPAGDVLASYRDQKAANPLVAPLTRRRTLTKAAWSTLLSLATPGPEREHFMRDAALKRLTIKD